MASNPPFELEDQTDEDFFDKLVNDDDDDDVGGGLKSSTSTGLVKTLDVSDGDESDEVKMFANLTLSEGGNGIKKEVEGGSVNDGSKVEGGGEKGVEVKEQSPRDDDKVGGLRVEEPIKEESVGDGEVTNPLLSSNSISFDNGHVYKDGGAMTTEATSSRLKSESSGSVTGGVKEVQWTSFSETAELGDDSFGTYMDFFTGVGEVGVENLHSEAKGLLGNEATKMSSAEGLHSHAEYQGGNVIVAEQSGGSVDTNNPEYWESLYPGWKYDANTGQWYQLDGSDGTPNGLENSASSLGNRQGSFDVAGDSQWAVSDVQKSQVSYAQQTARSDVGTGSQISTAENVSDWNQISQQNGEYQYPAHMVFDPQYPGWYYDTIVQEWRSLETYHSAAESTDQTHQSHDQQAPNGFVTAAAYSHGTSQSINNDVVQGVRSEGLNQSWVTSFGDYSQQVTNAHQSEAAVESRSAVNYIGSVSSQGSYDSNIYSKSHVGQNKPIGSLETVASYDKTNWNYDSSSWAGGLQSFVPTDTALQQFSHTPQGQQTGPVQYASEYYGGQNTATVSQPFLPNGHHVPYAPSEGRSSAGRPPHALVTFGFGGKLVVMKDNSSGGLSSFGGKGSDGHSISVLNLMEVVDVNNSAGTASGACSYFHSLCHQSFPGPLVGGNAGTKELNKWVDERITHYESSYMDYGKSQALKLLLSLLKIACQHYGKLRSFGADSGIMENDLPESAVAKLFASAKTNGAQFGGDYGAIKKCFTSLPSEAQLQATASEVQNLLISGRKMEALQCAQDGQLWEFALILARQLGGQFYADTVKQMAVSQLVVGSPLRTLCLLIAKKPEEVFSANNMAATSIPGAVHTLPQSAQNVGSSMLDNWEENLAVITANRTENDHLVIIHLGDCLWKEKNDVIAAHICYLIAEANFELYSDSARLCLIGADHLNFARTYASPEAIQRTEVFEYSKALGNSQFALLSLQPYKLVYAHMLAEVGRVSDSLKYCQAIYKSLKTGRSPETDMLKQLLTSLEERIRFHQQSGYAANLAPAKIVGKLLNFFDSTAHRVVGGLPPPVPQATQGSVQGNELHFQTLSAKVSSSQSTMAMSSLTPSASMEPISQWAVDGSRMTLQNRSISEPDIGRTPKPEQTGSTKEASASSTEGKPSATTGTSRFGRFSFGTQILQKTVGLVLKPRQDRQAKLGETNKFYYDEKLKRWVEEGSEPPAEETALAPPPTTAAFQSGKSDYNLNNALNGGLHATDRSPDSTSSAPPGSSPGIPAIPSSSNQFSARGRMGVRSRYVDTFNKGGGASTNMFQPPSVPSAKPASVAGAKFFVPTAVPSNDQTIGTEAGSREEVPESGGNPSTPMNDPLQNLAPSPAGTMQRFPSVDNIPNKGTMGSRNSSLASQSRRTASWSDIRSDTYAPSTSGMSPVPSMPSDHSLSSPPMNGGNFGEDLQEVEL